jgi:hypothetical protein
LEQLSVRLLEKLMEQRWFQEFLLSVRSTGRLKASMWAEHWGQMKAFLWAPSTGRM